MDEAASFIYYFRESLDQKENDQEPVENVSESFFPDFIQLTPVVLGELENYLQEKQLGLFYNRLNDLKYLCVFDENLNLFWFCMRALSGALTKLGHGRVNGTKKLHQYYLDKYGGREALRNENWFENRRWIFLDALEKVETEEQLKKLIENYHVVLNCYLENYKFHLGCFCRLPIFSTVQK